MAVIMSQQPPHPQGQWRPPPPPSGQPPQQPQRPTGQPPFPRGPGAGPQPLQSRPQLGWSLSNPDPAPRSGQDRPPGQQHGHHAGQQSPGQWNQGGAARAPLGQQEPASVSIQDFQQPPSRKRWIVPAVIGLIIAGLAFAMYWNGRTPVTDPTTPPGSSAGRPTEPPSAVPTGNQVGFQSPLDNAEGEWEIVKHSWTDRGLELEIRIKVTKGSFGYSFFALDNASVDDYDTVPINDSNALDRNGRIGEGEEVRGLIVFDKPRGDTTVYLATRFGRQLSALGVKG